MNGSWRDDAARTKKNQDDKILNISRKNGGSRV